MRCRHNATGVHRPSAPAQTSLWIILILPPGPRPLLRNIRMPLPWSKRSQRRRATQAGLRLLLTAFILAGPRTAGVAATPPPDADNAALNAVGPPLTALPAKIADPRWLVAWLLKPSQVRPGTSMPDSGFSTDEALAVARYLLTGAAPAEAGVHWQGGDSRTGEQLFVSRGCRGCDAIKPDESSVSARVPNLSGIGLKVRGAWLFNWIKAPRTYNPDTPMPRLVLTDDEIRHLVAFLLTRKAGAEHLAAAPRFTATADPAQGRALIARYECAQCHAVAGSPPPAPAFELARDHTPDAALSSGRKLVAYYNCRGCHRIEDTGGAIAQHLERKTFAPPTLEAEGARVQTSWLTGFLQHPTALRPWLQLRMPDYGFSPAQASAFAQYFAALAEIAAVDEPRSPGTSDHVARGLRRVAHYKCVQCHPTSVDQMLPEGTDPENLSINLMLAKTRLRSTWIKDFLARPKAIAGAQTRMPTVFYSVDGQPKVETPQEDIDDITTYLMGMTEPPEVSLRAADEQRAAEMKRQHDTDWMKIEY
jgi:cytochrome c2